LRLFTKEKSFVRKLTNKLYLFIHWRCLGRKLREKQRKMSKQMSSNKEINKLVKKAIKQNWRVEKGNANHLMFYPPDSTEGIVTVSSTPSSPRNHKNMLSLLKAKGLIL